MSDIATGLHFQGYQSSYEITLLEKDCCPILQLYTVGDALQNQKSCFPNKILDSEMVLNKNMVKFAKHCVQLKNNTFVLKHILGF